MRPAIGIGIGIGQDLHDSRQTNGEAL